MKKRIILTMIPLMGLVASLIPQEVLAATCSKFAQGEYGLSVPKTAVVPCMAI